MKKIKLTQGKFTLVDNTDYDWLNEFKWCAVGKKGSFYCVRHVRKKEKTEAFYMHRIILSLNDPSVFVDHRNGNPLDNQRHNLRPCTCAENIYNQKKQKGTSSRFKGVVWHKRDRRWQASIRHLNYQTYLGQFKFQTQAARAYNEAAKEKFGEFSRLNKV